MTYFREGRRRSPFALLAVVVSLGLNGCAFAPGGHIGYDTDSAPIDDLVDVEPITLGLVRAEQMAGDAETGKTSSMALSNAVSPAKRQSLADGYQYHIGIGDVLSIIVYDHPELTIPAGSERPTEDSGSTVYSDGTIFYPYVGRIPVAGRTVEEVRSELQRRLATYITEPQVDVKVAGFQSQKVYVTGQIEQPGVLPITNVPMTVLDAINTAGGLNGDANWHDVVLTRGDREFHIDVYAMLQNGNLEQNRLLKDGDVLHVSDLGNQKVFVMGEVMDPVTLPMGNSRLSLTDALSEAGGMDEAQANAKGIFVIRQAPADSGKLATVYQLDARNATALVLGAQFMLQPTDIVYVTAAPLSRWNRVVNQLTPTISSVYQVTRATRDFDELRDGN
ncbi:polysaccharide export protein [Salinicola rhizosphaerae]|uniref:Polysaccharide export protein Wza n=1 Tax=Salinicola rhizosphaerae TaxID=1443141 RepID=A0ABQ3DQR1_9GAMM|nr:polysaccharide export protein [Salinicola rhizosphaerae]GHB09939.1 polysaccharide export protein Wza [Salinicola rhizosphaerae]